MAKIIYTEQEKEVLKICKKAKKCGFLGLTNEEQVLLKPFINTLVIKSEGHANGMMVGPLYVETKFVEKDKFFGKNTSISFNFENGKQKKVSERGTYYAAWFCYNSAIKNAKILGVPLEEY